jgi:hypothetical protein
MTASNNASPSHAAGRGDLIADQTVRTGQQTVCPVIPADFTGDLFGIWRPPSMKEAGHRSVRLEGVFDNRPVTNVGFELVALTR